jgi:hypothetical protein
VLPLGIHKLNENEFADIFVHLFPKSINRPLIANKFANFRQIIKKYVSTIQWIDGSFVESKENPNDVDVVFLLQRKNFIIYLTAYNSSFKLIFVKKVKKK